MAMPPLWWGLVEKIFDSGTPESFMRGAIRHISAQK